MIIAIIGADGTGKTTIAGELSRRLSEKNKNVKFNKAFENYFLLGFFFSFLKRRRQKVIKEVFVEGEKPPSFFIKYIWPIILYIDQLFLFLYIKLFEYNKVHISDRYVYSFLVSWEYYGISNPLITFLYTKFPKPDLGFILEANPDELMRRKAYQKEGRGSSYKIEFFNKHLNLYKSLNEKIKFEVVNTEQELDNILECISKAIKKKMS